jgi:hypothetical protein
MKMLSVLLLLVGCEQPGMTNQQIILETKLCEDAGMRAVMLTSYSSAMAMIQCRPHKEDK